MSFALIYNTSIAVGVALVAAGVAMLYGLAWSLIVAGLLILALTVFAGFMVARSGRGKGA